MTRKSDYHPAPKTATVTPDNWADLYISHLVGCKIVAAGVADEDGETWPYFKVVTPDGVAMTIEVSQDQEGNGPGFLFGLPNPHDYYAAGAK